MYVLQKTVKQDQNQQIVKQRRRSLLSGRDLNLEKPALFSSCTQCCWSRSCLSLLHTPYTNPVFLNSVYFLGPNPPPLQLQKDLMTMNGWVIKEQTGFTVQKHEVMYKKNSPNLTYILLGPKIENDNSGKSLRISTVLGKCLLLPGSKKANWMLGIKHNN